MSRRLRVVVCGTKFGRVYLDALVDPALPFEAAGILARGSARSRACAGHYGLPLYARAEELPPDIDVACVVVGGSANGGDGSQLALQLMERGLHVLQEHPVHPAELAESLRQARRRGVVYQLNTHYVHIAPVRTFLRAAGRLLRVQRPLFVDAACAVQTAFSLFDIIGSALGRLRPYGFAEALNVPDEVRGLTSLPAPFRVMAGVLGGVPATLTFQGQLDPGDLDNHAHLYHRITLGTEGGTLALVGTHGPVYWSPRAHMPPDLPQTPTLAGSRSAHLDLPIARPLGPAFAPSYREVLGRVWPDGVRRALLGLKAAIEAGPEAPRRDQYALTLCEVWRHVLSRLGPVEMIQGIAPEVLPADLMEEYS